MNNREKNTLKNKGQHLRDLWSKKKKKNVHSYHQIPEGKEIENTTEIFLEEIITENLPNLAKEIKLDFKTLNKPYIR